MNIEQEWKKYRDACYPRGIARIQEQETRQAFCAGLLIAFQAVKSISCIEPEEEALRQMSRLETNITESNRQGVHRAAGN